VEGVNEMTSNLEESIVSNINNNLNSIKDLLEIDDVKLSLKPKFSKYLREKRLQEKTICNYLSSIDLTSKEAIEEDIINKSIYEVDTKEELNDIMSKIRNTERFIIRKNKSNNTNTASLSHYASFLDALGDSTKEVVDENSYWFVEANWWDNGDDQTQRFLENGVWENKYDHKCTVLVNQMKQGDRIAIKASYTKRNGLPFENNGNMVSVMSLKAIGTITNNFNDGKKVEVDWDEIFDTPKEWYLFTTRQTVWKVQRSTNDWMYGALVDFAFYNKAQNYDIFLEVPYWKEKYSIEDQIYEELEEEIEMNLEPTKYNKEDFLNDVFIDYIEYDKIKKLLEKKKNIILEGPPGVGKTFMAKRFAYSLMGNIKKKNILSIQFHQSYSYEDFIEGYRPQKDGSFDIVPGVFTKFCNKAKNDPENNYYCIIDEINRGNLSKILGELMMLIEYDKRGESLQLPYSKKTFSVPENLYIIGLMNTADRSLALIDYALRRRFSFVTLKPAFEKEKFISTIGKYYSDMLENLFDVIIEMNKFIEEDVSLGKGFEIGHSYFCNLTDGSKEELENIILFDLIPMIKEYWFDDKESLSKWENALLGALDD